jgi:hypothetical protein
MARGAGRPTTKTPAGQKVTLSIRTTAGMKSRLADAAEAEGRNLSEEAERRLEDSFGRIENLFGGPKGFALAKMLFSSFVFAGERAGAEDKRGLSLDEAAEYCGVSGNTLTRHGPTPIKIGEHKVYDRRSLDHWLDQLAGIESRQPAELPRWAWLNDNNRLQAALSGLFRAVWAQQEGASLDDLQNWLQREFYFAQPASGFVPSEGQSRDAAAALIQGEKPKCSP